MDSTLDYSAYEHKFKEGDIVTLKDSKELEIVGKMVKESILGDADCSNDMSWCLTQEKKEILSDEPLKIMTCISWHMGIPFYKVKFNDELYDIAEFYIQKAKI